MRDYELVLVVSPEGGEEGFPATVERVHNFITGRGGAINNVDAWGRRRLAYQINRYSEGYYNITHFAIDPQEVRVLEGSLDLADDILRHLIVRLDELPVPVEAAPVQAEATAAPDGAAAPLQAEATAAPDEAAPPAQAEATAAPDEAAPPAHAEAVPVPADTAPAQAEAAQE
ncbi:MAG TPA: 30S ribosomal protein S6 [Dehalococcoidia bacterium]|nr:30S ribosomal protein S6 [Dehalococcoidia bacterium]